MLVKIKILFDRGRYWVGYLTFLMLIFVTVTSMREYAYFRFLSSWYWLVIMLVGAVGFMLLLGYIELRHTRAYQKEAEIYARLNPVQKRIFENQEKILGMLSRLEDKIDGLKGK